MFGKPIHEIKLEEIASFLETGIREGAALDFKRDFPSSLEKTLSAFANTYGGIVLIGVDETPTGTAALPITGVDLKPGLRERVLQKSLEAIYPPILPEVHVIEFKSNSSLSECDRALVVVSVAESADAPHAVEQRTIVYLRGDNVSTRSDRKATIGEIEWLVNKRQRSLELKQRLIAHAGDRAEAVRDQRHGRYRNRHYWKPGQMKLTITPTFPRLPLMAVRDWYAAIKNSYVELNSAPRGLPIGRSQLVAGGVFFDGDYGYSEYQSQGLILHEFDYWWDYHEVNQSAVQRRLYPDATAALFRSVLENARKVYKAADYQGTLDFSFEATGLKGAFFLSTQAGSPNSPALVESNIRIDRSFSVDRLQESYIEIAKECQQELYWDFGVDASDVLVQWDFQR